MTKTANITADGRIALTSVGTSRVGAPLPAWVDQDTRSALWAEGLVTQSGNLTMKGSILRDRIQDEDLMELFGV